jgi:hypothetical protein
MVRTVYTFSIAGASAAFCAGCNDREDADRQRREAIDRAAHDTVEPARAAPASPSVDAASLTLPIDPPAPAGDLKSELAGYTTLDACVSARAKTLDPLLSDTLGALGYDTFLRDSCRVLEATRAEDAGACGPILASQLRARCADWVAIARADPAVCPLQGEPDEGRDPLCLAVAARNEHACLAVPRDRRATCVALVRHDPHACAGAAHADQCAREVERLRDLVAARDADGKPPPFTPPAARLELHGVDGGAEPQVASSAINGLAEGGLVTVRTKKTMTVRLGTGTELGTTSYVPPAHGAADVSVRLKSSGDGPLEIEHLELSVPGAGILVVPGVSWEGVVRLDGDLSTRGAPCHLVIKGAIGVAPRVYALSLDVQTYIRDVVTE